MLQRLNIYNPLTATTTFLEHGPSWIRHVDSCCEYLVSNFTRITEWQGDYEVKRYSVSTSVWNPPNAHPISFEIIYCLHFLHPCRHRVPGHYHSLHQNILPHIPPSSLTQNHKSVTPLVLVPSANRNSFALSTLSKPVRILSTSIKSPLNLLCSKRNNPGLTLTIKNKLTEYVNTWNQMGLELSNGIRTRF